jgi:hypothetical protein
MAAQMDRVDRFIIYLKAMSSFRMTTTMLVWKIGGTLQILALKAPLM